MAQLIGQANLFGDQALLPLTSVSPEFRVSLTPWLLSIASENQRGYPFPHVKIVAQSPTFQFTRSVSLFVLDEETRDELLASSPDDLRCTIRPLFRYLRNLTLLWTGLPFINEADETAKFVLKFRGLETFTFFAHPESEARAVVGFNMMLLTDAHVKRNTTLLASLLSSFGYNLLDVQPGRFAPYRKLFRRETITLDLQKLMLELCNGAHCDRDHLASFLHAIRGTLRLDLDDDSDSDSDSDDEDAAANDNAEAQLFSALSLTLELIETIILNKDVFHSSFADVSVPDLSKRKFSLALRIFALFRKMLERFTAQQTQLLQDYGTVMFEKLFHLIVENDDSSDAAVTAMVSNICGHNSVTTDTHWIDSSNKNNMFSDSEFTQMINGGRKCLEHLPFQNIAYVLKKTWNLSPFPDTFTRVIANVCGYMNVIQVSVGSDASKDAVLDVANRIIDNNIPYLLLKCTSNYFETHCKDAGGKSADSFPYTGIAALNLLLGAIFKNEDDDDDDDEEEEEEEDDDSEADEYQEEKPQQDNFTTTIRNHFFGASCATSARITLAMKFIESAADYFEQLVNNHSTTSGNVDTTSYHLQSPLMQKLSKYGGFAKEINTFNKVLRYGLMMSVPRDSRRRARDASEKDEVAFLRQALMRRELLKYQNRMGLCADQYNQIVRYGKARLFAVMGLGDMRHFDLDGGATVSPPRGIVIDEGDEENEGLGDVEAFLRTDEEEEDVDDEEVNKVNPWVLPSSSL